MKLWSKRSYLIWYNHKGNRNQSYTLCWRKPHVTYNRNTLLNKNNGVSAEDVSFLKVFLYSKFSHLYEQKNRTFSVCIDGWRTQCWNFVYLKTIVWLLHSRKLEPAFSEATLRKLFLSCTNSCHFRHIEGKL